MNKEKIDLFRAKLDEVDEFKREIREKANDLITKAYTLSKIIYPDRNPYEYLKEVEFYSVNQDYIEYYGETYYGYGSYEEYFHSLPIEYLYREDWQDDFTATLQKEKEKKELEKKQENERKQKEEIAQKRKILEQLKKELGE